MKLREAVYKLRETFGGESWLQTVSLYQQGMPPKVISDVRELPLSEIYAHLEKAILRGKLQLGDVIAPRWRYAIKSAYDLHPRPYSALDIVQCLREPMCPVLAGFILRALGLRLGGGRRILPHEREAAQTVMLDALQSAEREHSLYTFVQLLVGEDPVRQIHTPGLFRGYDKEDVRQALLGLLQNGRVVVKFGRLIVVPD